MSTVPASAPAPQVLTLDLSGEVSREAFEEGVRARWLPEVGLAEITTVTRGCRDIWEQLNASSEEAATDWVRYYDFEDVTADAARGCQ